MKKIIISALALVASVSLWAQGAHDFKITEVFVAPQNPTTGYQEEYGDVTSWIEIENTSYTTHDIRNCFLTTDRKALDENLSAPEREQLMSVIQKGDERTLLKGKQRITFFADGNTNRGVLHTNFKIEHGKSGRMRASLRTLLTPLVGMRIKLRSGRKKTLMDWQ